MIWNYVEPFCGSAAIALALHRERRPLVPYQGGKWRHRETILSTARGFGFKGKPAAVTLCDAGPWGDVARTAFDAEARPLVIDHLREMATADPKTKFDELNGAECPKPWSSRYAAEFLFLSRLSFRGNAVDDNGNQWNAPGFNPTSAYGTPATERFGVVHPMVPSLIRVLEGYTLRPTLLNCVREPAGVCTSRAKVPTLVYIDPPYQGTAGYPAADCTREALVEIALSHKRAGAHVIVSESNAVAELVILHGWNSAPLKTTRPAGKKRREWITFA